MILRFTRMTGAPVWNFDERAVCLRFRLYQAVEEALRGSKMRVRPVPTCRGSAGLRCGGSLTKSKWMELQSKLPIAAENPWTYTWAGLHSNQDRAVQSGQNTVLRLTTAASLLCMFALPVLSKTHKVTYPDACGEVWAAVKDTLGNTENYTIKITDESRMTVSYSVKHSAHVTVTGALRQRPNTVSLSSQGTGCEVQVQSNYSGFEHNDAGDFTKRVNESLAKRKEAAHTEGAKPADAK